MKKNLYFHKITAINEVKKASRFNFEIEYASTISISTTKELSGESDLQICRGLKSFHTLILIVSSLYKLCFVIYKDFSHAKNVP